MTRRLSDRPRLHRLGVAVACGLIFLTGTGCSSTMDHDEASGPGHETSGSKATTLDVGKAKDKAKAVSSQIYELIDIRKGKVTQPGPSIATCDQDPDHLYQTVHAWSVYGVSEDELKAGFQRLKEGLPGKGWKIVQYGPNKSKDRTLEMTADSRTEPFSVNAELWVSSPTAGHEKEPKILVNVESGCWRAPKGTDLNTEY
ncbi:hypothetical protein S1361_23420 [Streptomyces cyanogenus]|uniref:Lipoprotein n=2 Tax=Streptomyces cyanogenus TaxID=80860 RepID=A0ABX7TU58_STRCY|nr:hypothetical protein S1361_23420 [Streptomyces cyanogenus]